MTIFSGLVSLFAAAEGVFVLYNSDLYPLEFTNDRGQPDGFVIDLLYALGRESAMEIHTVRGNWKRGEQMLFDGQIDLVTGYDRKTENSSIIRSKALFAVPFTLLYRKTLKPSDEKGLYSRIPIISSGDSSEQVLEERTRAEKIIHTKSWSDSAEALEKGYGDYTIISALHSDIILKDYCESLDRMAGFDLSIPFLLYATTWNKELIDRINISLSIIRASGEYRRIYEKWFGSDDDALITYKDEKNRTGIILAAVLAAAAVITVILKRMRKVKE